MGSLITKANKRRSAASQKPRTSKAKKAVGRKPQRPGRITSKPAKKTKAPKQATARKPVKASKKQVTTQRKQLKASKSKKPVAQKKIVAKSRASTRVTRSGKTQRSAVRTNAKTKARAALPRRRLPLRPVPAPPPPKKPPSPGTLAAVKAFESALKQFNRHDFGGARHSFEGVLAKFGDEAEVAARVRTYLAICEQRLARTPNLPRNADALYDQGVFEMNRGDVVEAIELFEKALKVDPRGDHILYSLAAAFAHRNEPSKALDLLRKAISVRPVNKARARRDLDFATLRNNDAFQQLIGYDFESPEEEE
jgi:hypothetical protein